MMGERTVAQEALFYGFSLERYVPADHLLRSIDRGTWVFPGLMVTNRSVRTSSRGLLFRPSLRARFARFHLPARLIAGFAGSGPHIFGGQSGRRPGDLLAFQHALEGALRSRQWEECSGSRGDPWLA